jgi:hypothetical protein
MQDKELMAEWKAYETHNRLDELAEHLNKKFKTNAFTAKRVQNRKQKIVTAFHNSVTKLEREQPFTVEEVGHL